jgi:hypothetical protein
MDADSGGILDIEALDFASSQTLHRAFSVDDLLAVGSYGCSQQVRINI